MPDENNKELLDVDAHHNLAEVEPAEATDACLQQDDELGALITSGHGKDTRRTAQFYLILLALAIVPIGAGYFLAIQFGYQLVAASDVLWFSIPNRTVFYYIYICAGVVLAVALVFAQMLIREQIGKTEIFVYENGIEGIGLKAGKVLSVLSGAALQPFRLMRDQISLVSAGQRAAALGVMIDAYDEVFGVYPPNIAEILSAVNRNEP